MSRSINYFFAAFCLGFIQVGYAEEYSSSKKPLTVDERLKKGAKRMDREKAEKEKKEKEREAVLAKSYPGIGGTGRYLGVGSEKAIFRLDTETGRVSWCTIYGAGEGIPDCTPWTRY